MSEYNVSGWRPPEQPIEPGRKFEFIRDWKQFARTGDKLIYDGETRMYKIDHGEKQYLTSQLVRALLNTSEPFIKEI